MMKPEFHRQRVLVIGLGASGRAACRLLHQQGAQVTGVDQASTGPLQQEAEALRSLGIPVQLGVNSWTGSPNDLAVVSPGVALANPLVQEVLRQGVPLVGELELGSRFLNCPAVAITGTNGKTTTTELVERLLTHCGVNTVAAGNIGLPLCAVVETGRPLEYLTLEVSSFQLETIETFRPRVAVLLNVTPDHLDRYASMADYAGAKARLFEYQQPEDWAIVQLEALAAFPAVASAVRCRLMTFSTTDSGADLYLDGDCLRSRLSRQPGLLLRLAEGQLRGQHNAENLLAALGVALSLGLPLDRVVAALHSYAPAPHRCELVAEIQGVQFVNDSKATNLDAVLKAVLAMPAGPDGRRNLWLIAGGKDKHLEYEALGPALAQRVKGAFLLGETREILQRVWHRFTPCTVVDSLLEAVSEAGRVAACGDVILLSPACSSFDMFQNYQHRGEMFREAVRQWARQRSSPAATTAGLNVK